MQPSSPESNSAEHGYTKLSFARQTCAEPICGGADLSGAILERANLQGANLSNAILDNANTQGAIFD
ncbi:MAG TPA: pentapeptide repeat-containing protein [Armatimonadota bacterium]|nr:pentapeptide repeat-containing protein [Armatimonadota bacterium]